MFQFFSTWPIQKQSGFTAVQHLDRSAAFKRWRILAWSLLTNITGHLPWHLSISTARLMDTPTADPHTLYPILHQAVKFVTHIYVLFSTNYGKILPFPHHETVICFQFNQVTQPFSTVRIHSVVQQQCSNNAALLSASLDASCNPTDEDRQGFNH